VTQEGAAGPPVGECQGNHHARPIKEEKQAMKLEKLRHHVLEGIRSFASDPPTTDFQEGFLDALESFLSLIDNIDREARREEHITLKKVRECLRYELNFKDAPSDCDYIFGWRAAFEEIRRVLNYVPSYRLQFKVPPDRQKVVNGLLRAGAGHAGGWG
jgi:hypothetical protein